MGAVYSSLLALFWSQEMEIAVLGLQSAGKSSLVQRFSTGEFTPDLMPTIGFQMYKVKKGATTLKIWDLGGQSKFRSMWSRYSRGCQCIVFVIDVAAPREFDTIKQELNDLCMQTTLTGIPMLFLFNKNDLQNAVPLEQAIEACGIRQIQNRQVSYFSISCKNGDNIDKVLQWLTARARDKSKA